MTTFLHALGFGLLTFILLELYWHNKFKGTQDTTKKAHALATVTLFISFVFALAVFCLSYGRV